MPKEIYSKELHSVLITRRDGHQFLAHSSGPGPAAFVKRAGAVKYSEELKPHLSEDAKRKVVKVLLTAVVLTPLKPAATKKGKKK